MIYLLLRYLEGVWRGKNGELDHDYLGGQFWDEYIECAWQTQSIVDLVSVISAIALVTGNGLDMVQLLLNIHELVEHASHSIPLKPQSSGNDIIVGIPA
jgi:hypothetical protein